MSMIHEITAKTHANKRRMRKGRGRSAGKGKTAGRGTKGSKARVGTYIKPTYEGGQTELAKRFPKRGFSNVNFERKFHIVNLSDLSRFDNGATVDANALIEAGLVPDDRQPVKLDQTPSITASWAMFLLSKPRPKPIARRDASRCPTSRSASAQAARAMSTHGPILWSQMAASTSATLARFGLTTSKSPGRR